MKQYVVDAFTDKVFSGNPAAVCVMERWPEDALMQSIATENNLSETAFAVKENGVYRLRWFNPGGEDDMCGHATLATAYVITRFVEPEVTTVAFDTLSGRLTVDNRGELLTMNFPAYPLKPIPVTETMAEALGVKPKAAYFGADTVCVLENEEQLRQVVPNQELIRQMEGLCFHITAPGNAYDCVTRTFAPKCNVAEEPVCGRGHCHVIPYWASQTGKSDFTACQASQRGGILYCRFAGDRVLISGKAAFYSQAEIFV